MIKKLINLDLDAVWLDSNSVYVALHDQFMVTLCVSPLKEMGLHRERRCVYGLVMQQGQVQVSRQEERHATEIVRARAAAGADGG